VWGYNDPYNYMYATVRNGQASIGWVLDGITTEKNVAPMVWPRGVYQEIKVIIRDFVYELFIGGVKYPGNTYITSAVNMDGSAGVFTQGRANFTELSWHSMVTKHIDNFDCPENEDEEKQLIANFAHVLRIPVSHIEIVCSQPDSRKRQNFVQGVDIFIQGDLDIPAHALAEDLDVYLSNGAEDLSKMQLGLESTGEVETYIQAEVDPLVLEFEPGWLIEEGAEPVEASGFSAAEIAGVAVGGTAAVGAAGAGVVVAKKKGLLVRKKKATPQAESTPQAAQKGGIDMFNFAEKRDMVSITARGVPEKEWI